MGQLEYDFGDWCDACELRFVCGTGEPELRVEEYALLSDKLRERLEQYC